MTKGIPALAILMLLTIGGLPGCSEERGNRKTTTPVTGRITVDGSSPEARIKIECHPLDGMDTANPSISQCFSEPDGSFSISTYETGDGVPAGDYALTFFWGEMNLVSMSYGGEDKLGGRYDEPQESPKTFTVDSEEPIDLGVIALTTK